MNKNKIGIMTMQRIVNYGSFMQAYALKSLIEENTNSIVHFVDYKFEKAFLKEENSNVIKKVLKNLNIYDFIRKKKMQHNFIDYYNNYCIQPWPVGYSRNLFGYDYSNKVKTISYAASFGSTKIDMLREYKIDNEIKDLLQGFKNISVRDENSYNIVNELTQQKPIISLDPVLVYDFNVSNNTAVDINNYIILYAYTGRISRTEEKIIKRFAKKNNKKIVSIGFYQRIADKNIIINPFDIFSYFRNADFVITDTFHGSIFAIKTHTNFCTLIRNGNKNKVYDMLRRLDKTDRIIEDLNSIDEMYRDKIDFKNTDAIIKKEREKTIQYLINNLDK